ncbi:hypothetical protein ACLNGM_15075 [Aureimonas phyllosphaerae]|uniref:hypothetical protein n=1 Tax=Aureimonas phyllosphaerae TaxID=1166078 RepID=UPI003A5C6C40
MKAPVTSEPEAKAPDADPRKVDLVDAAGQPIGVTVTLKDDPVEDETVGEDDTPEAAHVRRLAKSITSWTSMEVDGEAYPFSQARAVPLLTRYPHFADQIGKALKL